MRILIEGPNGSGKSTLADQLKDLIQHDAVALVHKETHDQNLRYRIAYNPRDTIFVRGHISEAIYSLIYNRPAPFSDEGLLALDQRVDVVVGCLPGLATLEERYEAKSKTRSLRETRLQLLREMQLFQSHFKRLAEDLTDRPRYLGYNSEKVDRNFLLNILVELWKAEVAGRVNEEFLKQFDKEQRSFG